MGRDWGRVTLQRTVRRAHFKEVSFKQIRKEEKGMSLTNSIRRLESWERRCKGPGVGMRAVYSR